MPGGRCHGVTALLALAIGQGDLIGFGGMVAQRFGPCEAAEFLTAQGFACAPTDLRRLAGGLWNDVLCAQLPDRVLIIKHYPSGGQASLFPNLPEAEVAALNRLAGFAVAPDPVGFWPKSRILVYAHVPGDPWRDDLAGLAALLQRKEAVSPDGFRAVPLTAAEVLAQGDALLAACKPAPRAGALAALRPAPRQVRAPRRLSLVHTDVGAGNLIGQGVALRLIDWQCPAAGDLAEDVFSALSPGLLTLSGHPGLPDTARQRLLDALAMPDLQTRLEALEPAYGWRLAAYFLRRAQTVPDAAVRARYDLALAAEIARLRGEP